MRRRKRKSKAEIKLEAFVDAMSQIQSRINDLRFQSETDGHWSLWRTVASPVNAIQLDGEVYVRMRRRSTAQRNDDIRNKATVIRLKRLIPQPPRIITPGTGVEILKHIQEELYR